jgi:protein ImuB
MPRFAAIALVNLRIELAREAAKPRSRQEEECGFQGGLGGLAAPLAVVIARGGAVKDETSLLGNTRLDEVSPEAYELGIRPGHTVASARARSADLRVRVVPLESVEKTLAGIAEITIAFGPTTSFAREGFAGDVVWVDVTGCAHLHSTSGERELLSKLEAKVRALGHACQVAVADGAHVAAAVARFAPWGQGPRVVLPGRNAEALAKLPLAALGLEEKTLAWLRALGLRRVADLQRLPRASLRTRLDGSITAARVLALLEGDDRAPLVAYVPPEILSEEALLEYGIESAEALLFVAKRLAGRLAARLEGRCQKATRLELVLGLDLGVSRRETQSLEVVLATPLAREAELFAVLKTKIEAQDRVSGGVPFKAPILSVILRATEVVTARLQALDLLEPEAKADRALPKLATELVAELGPERVGTLALANSWVMEDRSRLLPYGAHTIGKRKDEISSFLSEGAEPTRILAKPKVVKRSSLLHSRLVARFEAVEWWRRAPEERRGSPQRERVRVEHYASWLEDKRAMAWVELEGEKATVKGFLD